MPVVMVLAMWSNVKQLLYRLPKKFRDTQSEQNRRRVIPLLERDNRLSRHTDRMRQFLLSHPFFLAEMLNPVFDNSLHTRCKADYTSPVYPCYISCQDDFTKIKQSYR